MFTRQSWAHLHEILAIALLTSLFPISTLAQTETVIHSFGSAGTDGQNPFVGLTEHAGAFYGTTHGGGPNLIGTVYAIKQINGAWKEKVLHAFTGGVDGNEPAARIIFDSAGNLYGTTLYGGTPGLGNGTVYRLSQQNGKWNETVLYAFQGQLGGGHDGSIPGGGLIFDAAGNLYGTTGAGGANSTGTVFKLTPSGNTWIETVIYNFAGKPDGIGPIGELIADSAGTLYGVTNSGGTNTNTNSAGGGTIFELSPNLDGTWSETVLHSFGAGSDGARPAAGMVADQAGNLYGTTQYGGGTPHGGHGTVFQLSLTNGVWTESVISNFTASGGGNLPQSPVIVDQLGNLYGAANGGGGQHGVIFKLSLTNGVWTHSPFYTFPDVPSGTHPAGNLLIDSAGNFYGTTITGGPGCGCHGLVYMLAP
jgi:uncharacterized repeat protein (TIGR03803 family)